MNNLLIFDGAIGTLLQKKGYKKNFPIINIENPQIIEEIHLQYLKSGANIIKTNTFNADINSLASVFKDKNYLDKIKEINKVGVKIAKNAILKYQQKENVNQELYIAGDIGASNKRYYEVDSKKFTESAYIQASEMIKGGVNYIILETMISLIEIKLLLKGIEKAKIEYDDKKTPIIVSISPNSDGNLILDGNIFDLEKITMIDYIGLNCGMGFNSFSKALIKSKKIKFIAPSLGIPKKVKGEFVYDISVESFSNEMKTLIKGHDIKFIGGCCGTSPEYIRGMTT